MTLAIALLCIAIGYRIGIGIERARHMVDGCATHLDERADKDRHPEAGRRGARSGRW